MLSVSLNFPFNPSNFEEYNNGLPSYQQPVFIRVIETVAMTETMKYIKKDLKKSAYDIHQIADPIYIKIPKIGYTRLTEQMYQELLLANYLHKL
ncbi:hypothetical protein MXB_4144 [Myxobolus squamalis]|nr:hypothetical protein MXB_4144 [Myxobolus squamalis]